MSTRRTAFAVVTSTTLALGTALVVAAPAQAATFQVTNTNDAGAGSLRAAIVAANGAAGADTITFAAGLAGSTIQIASPLTVTEALTITGLGSTSLSISRTAAANVFVFAPLVADQDFALSGITVQGDSSTAGSGVLTSAASAAPRNVTITDVRFQSLTTPAGGAGVHVDPLSGTLQIANSRFINNLAGGPGAAVLAVDVAGQIEIDNSVFSNSRSTGDGGAVAIDSINAFVTITGSQFTNNRAISGGAGGAIWIDHSNSLIVSGSTFDGNTADAAGGGLGTNDVVDMTVTSCTFFDNTTTGNRGGGLLVGSLLGAAQITDTVFDSNSAAIAGGGIATIDGSAIIVKTSRFINNSTAGQGGALSTTTTFNDVTVERSTFDGNTATDRGGALYFDTVGGGTSVTVDSSTFLDNVSAVRGNSIAAASVDGSLTIVNSTLDEQLSTTTSTANAYVSATGQFRIRYSTISGGVLIDNNQGLVEVLSTVIQGLTQPAISVTLNAAAQVSYSILSSPLTASISDGGGNQFSVADAKLGPLSNNGGPTLTRMPLATSPAIDSGLPGGTPPSFDQRFTGFPRVVGGRVDVGAVEVARALPATGAPTLEPLVVAVVLLGLGLALVVIRRGTVGRRPGRTPGGP